MSYEKFKKIVDKVSLIVGVLFVIGAFVSLMFVQYVLAVGLLAISLVCLFFDIVINFFIEKGMEVEARLNATNIPLLEPEPKPDPEVK